VPTKMGYTREADTERFVLTRPKTATDCRFTMQEVEYEFLRIISLGNRRIKVLIF
jgi:hypothetical protein